jgi:predicted dehydrogenase
MDGRSTEIGVGLVGYKFMGRAHSNAYRQVARFFDVDPVPRMRAICGRDEAGVREASDALGWEDYETDYRRLIERDDIDLVDISTPGNTHHEIALAALVAGKHVLCEKPLANTLKEAKEMVEAARGSNAKSMVCFNYRYAPAIQLAKQIIEEGRVGEIRHWRAVFLQDWLVDPDFPLTWRLKKETAGAGSLGDIGVHIVDLAHFLVGPITDVVGLTKTFVEERPISDRDDVWGDRALSKGRVTVDDWAAFLARFENGATGTFEVTRLAPGRKIYQSFEINGSSGSVLFDFERMNELRVCYADEDPRFVGYRTVMVTEEFHPYGAAWWPPCHPIGYEHTFVHVIKALLDGLGSGKSPSPDFYDGYRCQSVLNGVERSVEEGGWVQPLAYVASSGDR